ncbi:MAG: Gfo/Idh/MocA family protein [Candidatus Xenobia bacterium]
MTGVGIIGAGRIADLHVRGLERVVAVCDTRPGHAEARAREWGAARWYDRVDALLEDAEVDAVEIITPHDTHCALTLQALAAGKHVSVQKPMATSMEQARLMAEAAQKAGRVFRVFENFRYHPPYELARKLLLDGAIGDPQTVHVTVIHGRIEGGWPVAESSWSWRDDPVRCGGGPNIFDHGFHVFSLADFLMGPVESVFAWIQPGPVDRPAVISWRHQDSGRYGTWDTAGSRELVVRSRYYTCDERVQIVGSRGVLWINRCSGELLSEPPVVLYRDGETRAFENVETDWGESFVRGTRSFLEAIEHGTPTSLSADEGVRIMQFALAALRSASEGRPVSLAEL